MTKLIYFLSVSVFVEILLPKFLYFLCNCIRIRICRLFGSLCSPSFMHLHSDANSMHLPFLSLLFQHILNILTRSSHPFVSVWHLSACQVIYLRVSLFSSSETLPDAYLKDIFRYCSNITSSLYTFYPSIHFRLTIFSPSFFLSFHFLSSSSGNITTPRR